MHLKKLLNSLKEYTIVSGSGESDAEIRSLAFDSRQVKENSLFFCLQGGNSDGHLYAREAVLRGAVAIVTEREIDTSALQVVVKDSREALSLLAGAFYGHPSENLSVVGITGTNGKTTTTYMLASVFEKAGKKTGIIGTLGAVYAGKTHETDLTTPDPIALHKILADMFLQGVEYVFMEVSAHALWYKKTAGIRFAACIFTNLTQDHLDFFFDMKTYKNTKKKLFAGDCGVAVLNGDTEVGREFAGVVGSGKTLLYGLGDSVDATAVVTEETLTQSKFLLKINSCMSRVVLHIAGAHNIYNALAASACAFALGVEIDRIAEGLTSFSGVAGRLEWVGSFRGGEVFVDFAHTPDGLVKSLETLRKHCKGRLLCLFGCGGNRDRSKRPIMGERVAQLANFSVLSSDNPRYEDPLDILSEIEKGYRKNSTKYVVVPDREKAISYALDCLKKGDVLLVAGKGGERYQEIMGIKYPFDDNAIIKKIMEEKGNLC